MTNTPIAATEGGLLACPFCGDAPANYTGPTLYKFPAQGRAEVRCAKCRARGPEVCGSCDESIDALDEPARRAWNTRTPAPSLGEDVVEQVVEQLVEEGRAKKCSLNEYQRAAADDEARAFYRKVIHRYRAALSRVSGGV